ncbi:hypothetical protein VTH82DRAFT_4381 [Thermothelomyces myriococcoides]
MSQAMTPSRTSSSSTLRPAAARNSDNASIRPRNRRYLSTEDDAGSSPALSSPNESPSRGASPIPAARIGSVTGRNNPKTDIVRGTPRSPSAGSGLLGGSWTPSWASVQELASSLLTSGTSAITGESHRPRNGEVGRAGKQGRQNGQRSSTKNKTWGPEPPDQGRPCADDIAAGSRAEREAALRALRTASVLESHDGINGGLDTARRFKRRNSDENLRSTSENQETEEYLAYIHHVQATDTYAGIVLKYRCREDAFRKANGLWSRDNIQVRKWLAIPVDACEVKGRPCDPPTSQASRVDLLSRTPDVIDPFGRDGGQQTPTQDYFTPSTSQNGGVPERNQAGDGEKPWTHVRWVSIDSHPHPVEVARVPRKALGYFPPRRKRSIHTTSTISTPRASTDQPSVAVSEPGMGSPHSSSSRRPSLPGSRNASSSTSTTSPNRGRVDSTGSRASTTGDSSDPRPAWMRRPGGVGSLSRNVRAPGPAKDAFNSWTSKHLPGLNIDSLPSMSIMGSEIARFGFSRPADEPSPAGVAIVESPFEDGRDATAAASAAGGQQGTGLDKAAAAVETWLRGAFERAKQGPLTPVLGPSRGGRMASSSPAAGDLIELTDTGSEDGRQQSTDGPLSELRGLLSALPGAATAAVSRSTSPSPAVSASGSRPGQRAAGVRGRAAGDKKVD